MGSGVSRSDSSPRAFLQSICNFHLDKRPLRSHHRGYRGADGNAEAPSTWV